MSPSRPFILRPVATSLLMAAILLAGLVAYKQLPVSALPEVDYPTIRVVTFYPGASPDVVASAVTAPLERQFGQVPGLNQMTSTSSGGSSVIVLQFALNLNIDVAEQEVQAAINAAQTYLPANLPAPPIYSKSNPADAPILTLALTSASVPLSQVEDMADTRLAQKISQLPGVGLVSLSGGQKPAVRVQVNPTALSARSIDLEELRTALQQTSLNQAKGNFDGPQQAYQINGNDQLLTSEDYRSTVVAYRNGAPVMLSDVATVIDGAENEKLAAWMNRVPAVILNVQRQPGANIIQVVDHIKARLPQLKSTLAAGIDVSVLTDRTTTIRASAKDVQFELMLTVALVVLVIFLFLRTLAATIIPSVAVPLSLVGTFGVMYLLGYSLNNLTLMALTISTGFVVDDAIVMIENITRYIEMGEPPLQAALKGAEQIGFTIVSLTVSLIAVLIPLLFMGDIVGRLFREFAITLAVTIFVSAVVSLTLTPMMCARLLKHQAPSEHGRLYRWSEDLFAAVLGLYERSLAAVLRHPAITLLVLLITVGLNAFLFIKVPKGFFPQQDNGTVFGGIQGAQDASFQAMQTSAARFVNLIKADPAVENVMAFTGGNGAANSGFVYIGLKPVSQRKISASQIINRLRPKLASVPGATVFLQAGQDLRIGGRQSNAQYQYTIQSGSLEDLVKWGPQLLQQMRKLKGFTDVNSDQQNNGLQASLTYDRLTAARFGLTPQTIDNTLYDAFGQRQVSTMFTALNQYHVVMEVDPQFWQGPQGLNNIYLRSTNNAQVPLGAVSRFEPTTAPITVSHQGQFPSVTISFNLAPGIALSDAVRVISQMEQKMGLPARIHGTFSGTLQAFQASLASEPILIITALLAVYIVLGILYESYIHPITILSTLPSAGVGAVLALMLFHTDLSVIAVIGVVLLIGIVKKNAIMMIDFALAAEREESKRPSEAIYEACLLRFRPILMTTMAAMFGALPLVIGFGAGSELRRPLGIAIVGGLVVSQVLTLYTTPVVYLTLDRLRLRWRRWRHGTGAAELRPAAA